MYRGFYLKFKAIHLVMPPDAGGVPDPDPVDYVFGAPLTADLTPDAGTGAATFVTYMWSNGIVTTYRDEDGVDPGVDTAVDRGVIIWDEGAAAGATCVMWGTTAANPAGSPLQLPRFDDNGLRLEGIRNNWLIRSADLTDAAWIVNNCSKDAATLTEADYTLGTGFDTSWDSTAPVVIYTGTARTLDTYADAAKLVNTGDTAQTDGDTVYCEFTVKSIGTNPGGWIAVAEANKVPTTTTLFWVNLTTPAIGTTVGGSPEILELADGSIRVRWTRSVGTGAASYRFAVLDVDGDNVYTHPGGGTAGNGFCVFYGSVSTLSPDSRNGVYPDPYIISDDTDASRTEEILHYTGIPAINMGAGSLTVDWTPLHSYHADGDALIPIISLDEANWYPMLRVVENAGTSTMVLRDAGGNEVSCAFTRTAGVTVSIKATWDEPSGVFTLSANSDPVSSSSYSGTFDSVSGEIHIGYHETPFPASTALQLAEGSFKDLRIYDYVF